MVAVVQDVPHLIQSDLGFDLAQTTDSLRNARKLKLAMNVKPCTVCELPLAVVALNLMMSTREQPSNMLLAWFFCHRMSHCYQSTTTPNKCRFVPMLPQKLDP
jgi:hypothetical protein